ESPPVRAPITELARARMRSRIVPAGSGVVTKAKPASSGRAIGGPTGGAHVAPSSRAAESEPSTGPMTGAARVSTTGGGRSRHGAPDVSPSRPGAHKGDWSEAARWSDVAGPAPE